MKAHAIKEVDISSECGGIIELIRAAFADVAEQFCINRSNSPNYIAFITEDRLKEQLDRDGAYSFGIEEDGRWVGFVALVPDGGEYEISRLSVAPEYRHRGYGKLLMEHAENKAKKLGYRSVFLGIINENERLKRWYESLGFVAGKPFKPEGHVFSVCEMTKRF